MENELEKQIEDRLDALPEDIRAAIESSDFDKHIQTIGTANQLHLDQTGLLADEATLVMLGITKSEDFVDHIVEHVRVTKEVAQELANAISEKIFRPIQESMKLLHPVQSHDDSSSTEPVAIKTVPVTPAAPVATPTSTAATPAPAPAVADMAPKLLTTEVALKEPTVTPPAQPVSTPAPMPPKSAQIEKPKPYAADPYREPVE